MLNKKRKGAWSNSLTILVGVLLLIVVIGIIFIVVKGGEKESSLNKYQADLKIADVLIVNTSDVYIRIEKGDEEEKDDLQSVMFVFYDNKNKEITKISVPIEELEEKSLDVVLNVGNTSKIDNIAIVPVFISKSGEEIVGASEDSWENTACTPNCANKKCGGDGCGGSCGTCNQGYTCQTNGTCIKNVSCESHDSSSCYNGEVYWYNSCDEREEIRYNCNSTQTCLNGQCVQNVQNCTSHASSNCSGGDVYWWNSCGTREEIRYNCNSTQTCSNGACVNNNPPLPQTGAIIADHNAVKDFDIIPSCWIEEAKTRFVIGYGHTSHGSQITSGLATVKAEHGALYDYNNGGTNGALDYEEGDGYGEGWLDHDVGYGGWDVETRDYLDGSDPGAGTEDNSDVNTIMWSWCGQVGSYTTYSGMSTHYLAPAEDIAGDYGINFIYMTGHLDGGGPTGSVYTANNIIRQHVEDVEGILFDFADIESYDPDGNYYPTGSDDCSWCSTWCSSHTCPSCGSCAHSHCFNCYNKGKAFWWMMARMAGWDGTASDACP
jgi:hypothetical protein